MATHSTAGQLGRFVTRGELGRGAMGVVYQAVHPGLGVPVAIKVLAESYSRDESFRQRFQREASTIASLDHPGIVRVFDFDSDGSALFIVMEFVEGHSLRYWLGHSGRFKEEVALDLVQQLLSAVGAAHARGIVHRDLKPDNVLVSGQGKTKILDFGISKVVGDAHHLTATGSMVGTPAYMAPEQVRGEDVDHRADIYALGCILYELLHGQPPFTGTMPAILHAHVFDQPRPSTAIPEHLMKQIYRAMAKAPADRFQSCEEFAGALMQASRPDVVPVAPPPDAPPPASPRGLRALLVNLAPNSSRGAPEGGGACAYSECTAGEGWQCEYVDPLGERCTTWWCKRHVHFIDATPFCPRHGNVLRALSATAGTIREIKHRPAVGDRSLPLAALVADDVDRDLTELIRRRYAGRPGVRLAVDGTIRQAWEARGKVSWERGWAALQDQGYLTRIAVRVTASEPDRVKVTVGNRLVLSEVPDWISRRREGDAPDLADRARFRARVVAAVMGELESPSVAPETAVTPPDLRGPGGVPALELGLAEGMLLRLLATASRMTGHELGTRMGVPFATIRTALDSLAAGNFIESLGLETSGSSAGRPLPERMAYTITVAGRRRIDDLRGPRWVGPAPVSLDEYRAAVADSWRASTPGPQSLERAFAGLQVAPGVRESVIAAVNSRGSLFIYGAPGNGKTSLARRIVGLLGSEIPVPVAVDVGGEVIRVFDPSAHRLTGAQPSDQRWRTVERPVLQVGGEFSLEQLEPSFDEATRTYEAPLQVKALGGVLLIDDLGRQRATPKQILDRLLVPMEQGVDYLNLQASGRKVEMPFATQLVFSTNLKPAELLDEAYLRRLAYKLHMPDPTWEAWTHIFEAQRERLGIAPEPRALELIRGLYGGRPMRGNHPRDLLDRLVDVASARGERPELRPDLIQAAWQTLFVAG